MLAPARVELEPKVAHVACGGSFTLALDDQGALWSWGLYSGGRLGLGPPPLLRHDPRLDESRRRTALYQLAPKALREVRAGGGKVLGYHREDAPARPAPTWAGCCCGEGVGWLRRACGLPLAPTRRCCASGGEGRGAR